ncbi:MAG: NUDIX domain-containing protein [Proteobacteria bacterium]|nr:NUDIX domain-containing protein [Pseudomonadota bacterium]
MASLSTCSLLGLGRIREGTALLSALRRRFEPLLRRVFHFYWRFARGATLGAFALVIDGQRRVFLIQHSYVSGWHLPGGGVETGETIKTALARELIEEGNIKLTGEPVLHGVFHNRRISQRDHVALFVVRDFVQESPPVPDHEIVAHGFFAIDELPEDTGRAARARIAEVFEGRAVSELW